MSEEEQLIKSGLNSIVKAFNIKNTKSQILIEEKNGSIAKLKSKLSLLVKQIETMRQKTQFSNKIINKLKPKNAKLQLSLKDSQYTLKPIQKSVIKYH